MKKSIILIFALVVGCREPDFITAQCTHIYLSCDDPDYDFPTQAEMSTILEHFVLHGYKCGPLIGDEARNILSYMSITLACHGPSGKHYDNYFRDDVLVDWRGYDRIWTLYHELMHPMYRYYKGGTDTDHLDDEWWSAARCLTKLFELEHGWLI